MFKYRTKTYTPIAHLFEQEILRTEDLLISEVSQSLAFIILLHLIIPTLHLLFIVLRTGTGDMVTAPSSISPRHQELSREDDTRYAALLRTSLTLCQLDCRAKV